jgi:hypothetical protein
MAEDASNVVIVFPSRFVAELGLATEDEAAELLVVNNDDNVGM